MKPQNTAHGYLSLKLLLARLAKCRLDADDNAKSDSNTLSHGDAHRLKHEARHANVCVTHTYTVFKNQNQNHLYWPGTRKQTRNLTLVNPLPSKYNTHLTYCLYKKKLKEKYEILIYC